MGKRILGLTFSSLRQGELPAQGRCEQVGFIGLWRETRTPAEVDSLSLTF